MLEKPGQGQAGPVHVHRVQGHLFIIGGGAQDLQVKLLDDLAQCHAVLALTHAKPFLSFCIPHAAQYAAIFLASSIAEIPPSRKMSCKKSGIVNAPISVV